MTLPPGECGGLDFSQLTKRASDEGLAVRGGFHPQSDDLRTLLPHFPSAETVVLLGLTGSDQWRRFESSRELLDGLPDPLDRWSRRIIGGLAREFDGRDFYPTGTPAISFQRLATRCEPVHSSPIGILIHPRWGLWHAYRGALVFERRLELPPPEAKPSPCISCASRPCLDACPVSAFTPHGFDSERCIRHVESEAGVECRERGCLARRACPVAPDAQYLPAQSRFHMAAFLRAAGDRR